MTILDLQTIRYINLLDSMSRVKTSKCFTYNNTIFFAVSRHEISRAIGPNATNVHRIQEKLGKKVRVIAEAQGNGDAKRFVQDIVSPVRFKDAEIQEKTFVLTAGSQSKAALIGRNRRREDELKQIIKDTFSLELKIL